MSIEYETRRFEIGEVIFRQDDDADGFYVLQSGRVEILVDGPSDARISLAYVEGGDSFGEMSIVDGTPRTATAIAFEPSVTMFFARATLEAELNRAELLTFLLRNVCRKLAEQNREFSEHTYVDLQANAIAEGAYHSALSLEPISMRMERYLGAKRVNISRFPFPIGNTATAGPAGRTKSGLWLDAKNVRDFKGPHFQLVRQNNRYFVHDLSGGPGTQVNDDTCQQGGPVPSIVLRRGFNQITIPGRGVDFGFLAYVQ